MLLSWCASFRFLGFDFKTGKVTIGGFGSEPISWTSIPDIGRFVAHVLTALPKKELEWRTFRIEGDRQVRHTCNAVNISQNF